MKILEVRDGFIKFEADSNICLSSFIQVSGLAKSYIAQIIQIKRSGINSIAVAKILFLYDGGLQAYDKTLPPEDAEIKDFTFNILNNSINASEPVIAGEMPEKDLSIIIDASSFNKKMLMSIDDKDENNILIRNFTKQFNNLNKNVLIIDTLGVINAKKHTAGVDFKLPLDTASLAFMYQDCLNDATSDSKSLIVEIFRDLAEYSKTVPFVPFGALKNIVDDMVDKSHVFKLLVLKNKLAKFDKLGYFAKDKAEVDKVERILDSKCTIIDLSKLDSAFQNRYLAFLYEKLQGREDIQVFLELSNTVSKKNLKNILEDTVPTTFITHSRFKYLNDIKNLFDNFIISPSITNNEIFKVYNTFLKAMPKDTYLITGEAVNYIPLMSSVKLINSVIPQQRPEQAEENIENIKEEQIPQNTGETAENIADETAPKESTKEQPEEISEEPVEEVSEEQETAPAADEDSEETAQEVTEAEIIEPEILDDTESAEDFEEVIENKISNEEILANIEEKSDAVITEASKDLTPPSGNMFASDDEDEEAEEDSEPQEDFDEEFEEHIIQPDEIITEDIPQAEYNDTQILEELNSEPIEEVQDISEESAYENIEESEEIPLEEAFDNDLVSNEEIPDYVPAEENIEETDSIEELDLTDNIEESELLSEEDLNEQEETSNEETEIEIPEEFDLDSFVDNDTLETDTEEFIEPEEEQEILPISDEETDFDEIVELDPDEAGEDDIVIDMAEEGEDDGETISEENLDEQIVKDVDKVFTTRKDDDISDSDLDFIDELNNDDGVLEEVSDGDNVLEELSGADESDGILEDNTEPIELKDDKDDEILETRNSSTPIVPVYDADIPQEDMVISDPIQQGDTVTHAKYGSGVVEKMIKYGNKTLFSINFDNIGRRLLDPTLTEIKKA